jgi:hypothetical protein
MPKMEKMLAPIMVPTASATVCRRLSFLDLFMMRSRDLLSCQ